MFDDPKKNLKWLEQQLLEEEETEEVDWLEEELRQAHELMDNDYSRPAASVALYDYEEEVADENEDVALYADEPQPKRGKKAKKEEKPKKEKGIGGLVFLACIETLGIIAVGLWWVLWLL